MAPPFREAEFDIEFGHGISKLGELIDLGVANGVVEKSGTWFSYGEERLGQGRENGKQFLRDNPDIAERLERQIRIKLGLIEDETKSEEKPVEDPSVSGSKNGSSEKKEEPVAV